MQLYIHRPTNIQAAIQPDLRVLLFRVAQMFSRQQNSAINGYRQASVPPSNHHRAEDQLTRRVPRTAEAVGLIWHADTDAHGAVGTDDLEDVVEYAKIDRVALIGARLDHVDEEHGKDNPPQIVRELAAELLPDEIASALAGALLRCHSSLYPPVGSWLVDCFLLALLRVLGGDRVVGVDT